MTGESIPDLLDAALAAREPLFDDKHRAAFRLFNGFYEGCPSLAIDLYASTIVLHNYADPPVGGDAAVSAARRFVEERLPWVGAMVLKVRSGTTPRERRGTIVYGTTVDRRVMEHGVWYAIDLLMNRDASLYLDTRNLRKWALEHLRGKTVLNTFAYTGSLGVAAQAGGAARVVHLDKKRDFLNAAKTSYTLNGFPIDKKDFQTGDFWPHINRLKRAGELFDCVFLDPPFFAETGKGTVDLAGNSAKLINKVRPLVSDGGYLVAVNNTLFVSGVDYMATLESLCADGYLRIEELVRVPEDFAGYERTRVGGPPVDPAPFNHATKIAVLRVRRKDAGAR
ncbi:MAG: class I SAM-dependent methyltransferase [Chloroflexota bacterium]|nr:class I SAM-dependent methyltransferase [Chloroflexota bacterium]